MSRKIRVLGFFLIIMVTYIHSNNSLVRFASGDIICSNSPVHTMLIAFIAGGICSVAVPFFFAMSGYLFFHDFVPSFSAYQYKFKRRIFSLVIPYISWSILGLVIYFALQSIPFSKKFFAYTFVKDLSFRQIMNAVFVNPLPYQLWFIRNLIIYTIFTPIIYWALKRISVLSMFLIMGLLFVYGNQLRREAFYYAYFFYYLCGCFMAIKKIDLSERPAGKTSFFILLLWIVFLAIDAYAITVKGHPVFLLNNASMIIGIIALWWNYDLLFAWIEKNSFFWVTSFTFFIFAAHEPLMTVYKKALTYCLKNQAHIGELLYLIVPPLTVATLLVAGRIFKKHFRDIYDFLVGGRP